MVRYKQLLTYIKSAVTRNHSEKSINSILDYISTSKNVSFFVSLFVLLNRHFFDHLLCYRWNCCKISMKRRLKPWKMLKMTGFGSKPTLNLANCTLTETISANCRRSWNNCTNHVRWVTELISFQSNFLVFIMWNCSRFDFFRLTMVKMIWRRAHNCWKFMRWKFKCTRSRRTTRNLRHCTNSRCTSNRPFHIHWSWASFEVRFYCLFIHPFIMISNHWNK